MDLQNDLSCLCDLNDDNQTEKPTLLVEGCSRKLTLNQPFEQKRVYSANTLHSHVISWCPDRRSISLATSSPNELAHTNSTVTSNRTSVSRMTLPCPITDTFGSPTNCGTPLTSSICTTFSNNDACSEDSWVTHKAELQCYPVDYETDSSQGESPTTLAFTISTLRDVQRQHSEMSDSNTSPRDNGEQMIDMSCIDPLKQHQQIAAENECKHTKYWSTSLPDASRTPDGTTYPTKINSGAPFNITHSQNKSYDNRGIEVGREAVFDSRYPPKSKIDTILECDDSSTSIKSDESKDIPRSCANNAFVSSSATSTMSAPFAFEPRQHNASSTCTIRKRQLPPRVPPKAGSTPEALQRCENMHTFDIDYDDIHCVASLAMKLHPKDIAAQDYDTNNLHDQNEGAIENVLESEDVLPGLFQVADSGAGTTPQGPISAFEPAQFTSLFECCTIDAKAPGFDACIPVSSHVISPNSGHHNPDEVNTPTNRVCTAEQAVRVSSFPPCSHRFMCVRHSYSHNNLACLDVPHDAPAQSNQPDVNLITGSQTSSMINFTENNSFLETERRRFSRRGVWIFSLPSFVHRAASTPW